MQPVERLSRDDRLILGPDRRWPQDVGVVALLEGGRLLGPDGFRLDLARTTVASRLHQLPRFGQVLRVPRWGLGSPVWVDVPQVDLAAHVRVVSVPPPGDEAALLQVVEGLRQHRLDRKRPLWELWFLPGLVDSGVGMFARLHHVVADGLAGIATLRALLDAPAAADRPPAPRVQRRADRGSGVLRAVRTLVGAEPGPRTSLEGLVGPRRRLELVRVALGPVQSVAHASGATVNDVLLTVTGGGLRRLLAGRGELSQGLVLPVYVPVALGQGASPERTGNRIGQLVVGVPVAVEDPVARLSLVAARTRRLKAEEHPALGAIFRNRLAALLLLGVVARKRVNVETADLPGPTETLSFAGDRVREMFPLLNLVGNVTLGVGALSYAGALDVMLVADADVMPDLEEVATGMREDLGALTAGAWPAQGT